MPTKTWGLPEWHPGFVHSSRPSRTRLPSACHTVESAAHTCAGDDSLLIPPSPKSPPAAPQLPAAAALRGSALGRGALRVIARAYIRGVLMGSRRRVRCRVVTVSDVIREQQLR